MNAALQVSRAPTDSDVSAWLAQSPEVEDMDYDVHTGWSEHRVRLPWVAYVDTLGGDREVLYWAVVELEVHRDSGRVWRVDVATVSLEIGGRLRPVLDQEDRIEITERVETIVAGWRRAD